jgi:hypothetical protein
MIKPHRILFALVACPGLAYLAISLVAVAALACKVATRYSFNLNEGWNAYWASAAWSGADLYPPVGGFTFNNYPPIWFYLTGALGHLVGDDIRVGRAIAAAALLLIAAVISLIVREIVGVHKGWWVAGAAFLAMFAVLYQSYAAANDPQVLGSLLMTIAVLVVIRAADRPPSLACDAGVVCLMVVAGLVKHNMIAAPLSVALFLLLSGKPRALVSFVGLSVLGLTIAGTGLYLGYGKNMFTALLLPRPYRIEVAWAQTVDQLRQYGTLLTVIPFLAFRLDAKARLMLIYALVALLQGAVLSGGFRVDVNVFFDLLICVAVGLGVMAAAVRELIARPGPPHRLQYAAVTCWLLITLVPPALGIAEDHESITEAFAAVTDESYEAEVRFIRAAPAGPVVCRDLALCYWAGQPFNLDLNDLRIVIASVPRLEDEVVVKIERCEFSLVQLDDDWSDPVEDPLTNRIWAALVARYEIVREGDYGFYWRPHCA